jgi:hypothetical protein
MFVCKSDPHPDPLVTSTNPDADPDPSLFSVELAKKCKYKNFLAKNLSLFIKHIFTIFKLLNSFIKKNIKNMKKLIFLHPKSH